MKKFFKSKRGLVLLATMVAAIAAAIGANAYFSSTGAGSGNATVGASTNIVITNDTVGNLYPGGAAVSVPVHLQNPGGGNEFVHVVSGTVEDITSGPNAGCMGSWFAVAPITYNAVVNHGATNSTSTNVTMTDTGSNQDACQNANLTIDWSSN